MFCGLGLPGAVLSLSKTSSKESSYGRGTEAPSLRKQPLASAGLRSSRVRCGQNVRVKENQEESRARELRVERKEGKGEKQAERKTQPSGKGP